MKTIVSENGKGTPKDANQKDTPKGAGAMAIVEAKKSTVNPYSEKIGKIGALQRKVLQLQRLREVESDLREFEVVIEDDSTSLTFEDSKRRRFETGNAYLVKKVKELLLSEISTKIPELENEILTATI